MSFYLLNEKKTDRPDFKKSRPPLKFTVPRKRISVQDAAVINSYFPGSITH